MRKWNEKHKDAVERVSMQHYENIRKVMKQHGMYAGLADLEDALYEVIEYAMLGNGVVESQDPVQIGQPGSAQAKPENSDADFVCRDTAPSPN